MVKLGFGVAWARAQVGSPNLGMIAKDDISEEVFWDVYKTCSLFDLAEKELDEASLRPVNAKKMRIKHATENVRVTPTAGFRTVSPKEQLMLDYVEKFRLQFVELYPTRRPLLLFPPNECAVNKFVCTTVRPSQLPFTDLYDHPSCIRFVARPRRAPQLVPVRCTFDSQVERSPDAGGFVLG